MSFCCGASMIGTKGTVKHSGTHIHNVPLLFCPVCHRTEVHYLIEKEYEILTDYAQADDIDEADFEEYVELANLTGLYENCVSQDQQDPIRIVKDQIDNALDLMGIAGQLGDEEWTKQLKMRLRALSARREKLLRKKVRGSAI